MQNPKQINGAIVHEEARALSGSSSRLNDQPAAAENKESF
jgi:hypothetical protein